MKIEATQAAIANGAALSGIVDLRSLKLHGIQMPAAWTAAGITFQASSDGVTFGDVRDDAGAEVTVTAAASSFIVFRQDLGEELNGVAYLKVRSGTTGAPVNQGAARTLTLLTNVRT